ncbi:MAG: DNA repair protein RecN, partial [Eubacteriales bacterium]
DATAKALSLAEKLHEKRAQAAERLSKKVVETLVFLDMPKVTFRVSIETPQGSDGTYLLTPRGYDSVDFLISANSGEQMQSLSLVASGGELARMMLALKSVENAEDESTAMVFDEIDTGVSGKTARKIGMKLLDLSRHTQIFCVTHSAQIASLADVHFLIAKHEEEGRTVTVVSTLDEDGRIRELSRILGGIHVTEAQIQAAVDMRREKAGL